MSSETLSEGSVWPQAGDSDTADTAPAKPVTQKPNIIGSAVTLGLASAVALAPQYQDQTDLGRYIEYRIMASATDIQAFSGGEVRSVLALGSHDDLEPGMDHVISHGMSLLLAQNFEATLEQIQQILAEGPKSYEALAEVLRALGRLNELPSDPRLAILINALGHPNPVIRESAALAMADLDDPAAIKYLEVALETEPYAFMRKGFEEVIYELKVS